MSDINMREAYNDLWVWDSVSNDKWEKIDCHGVAPLKRMSHAGAVLGGLMMVYGGWNTEAKVVLDDCNLFDFNT